MLICLTSTISLVSRFFRNCAWQVPSGLQQTPSEIPITLYDDKSAGILGTRYRFSVHLETEPKRFHYLWAISAFWATGISGIEVAETAPRQSMESSLSTVQEGKKFYVSTRQAIKKC